MVLQQQRWLSIFVDEVGYDFMPFPITFGIWHIQSSTETVHTGVSAYISYRLLAWDICMQST
ncbi:hypothetical protein GY15_06400 [Delftia sp. 670]|nr:hypothetical protein GY15_06400 [Delftia sp. 670]OBY86189.1 hypothetical protein ACM14_06400 [Delftia sp. JD2]